MDTQMDDEVPILDEENYSTQRIEMKVHLKEIGAGVWKETIGGSVPLKNKSKFVAQRKKRRIMHWLSRPFLVDSQVLSKRSWDNALLPRIYG
jgi:hypothetical protein